MEINTKDELKSALDEILARLSVVEQSATQKKDNEKPKDDKPKDDKPKQKEPKVESADEIEKLLNS